MNCMYFYWTKNGHTMQLPPGNKYMKLVHKNKNKNKENKKQRHKVFLDTERKGGGRG